MRITIWLIAGMLLVFTGCASETDVLKAQRPKVFPVTGSVTLAGKPVEKAVVIFVGQGGSTARGTTDSAGKFSLMTFDQNDGAVAGPQQVGILKEVAGYDPNQLQIGQAPPPVTEAAKHPLPAVYADPKTSGLQATVSDKEKNNFAFDLVEKSK